MRFGTDGIRGPAGRPPIDVDGARRVGAAAARWAREGVARGEVWVARDTRPSGAALAGAVLAAASLSTARVVDAGVLPSGGLGAVLAARAQAGARAVGVMVTASHNPAADNGFKVLGPGGHKPDDDAITRLEASLRAPAPAGGRPCEDGAPWAQATWLRSVADAVGPLRALRGQRLVLDLAHGAASAAREPLCAWLRQQGLDIQVVAGGGGCINEGVGSEHPGRLAAAVRAAGADAGLAVDGDADRCVLVDELGQVVPGDALTAVLARGRGVRRLAVTIMSTWALESLLPGVDITRTPVGDRHLAQLLQARAVDLGAEESGHVLLGHPGLPGGDGLATGLATLVAARLAAPTLSTAWSPLAPWPRQLTKVRVRARPVLDEVPAVQDGVARATADLGGGRVFLRYSGTEPVLRVLVEGPSEQVVTAWSRLLTARCQEVLG